MPGAIFMNISNETFEPSTLAPNSYALESLRSLRLVMGLTARFRCSALFWRFRYHRRNQAPSSHEIFVAAPVNAIGCKARQPHHKINRIAQWRQPEFAAHYIVSYAPNAHRPCHGQAQNKIRHEICSANPGDWRNQRREQSPRKAVRENEPQKRERSEERR